MTRYHINPKTGNPNKCSAKAGNCPFKGSDGAEAIHYGSADEARVGYEKEMEQQAEEARLRKAEEEERNWPTPDASAVAKAEAKGYAVDLKRKAISLRGQVNGEELYIKINAGDVYASQYMGRTLGAGVTVNTKWSFGDKLGHERIVEFSDYGTSLSVDEAEAHVKDMESILKNSPDFLRKVNTAIEDAEELYGSPKDNNGEDLYSKVDVHAPLGKTRDGKALNFTVDGEEGYYTTRTEQATRWNDRASSDPNVYTGIRGERKVSISLSSGSRLTPEGYQNRIAELKDAIVTTKAMETELSKLPKPKPF